MKRISVVFHSGYGHTTNQANGIVNGIEDVDGVTARPFGIRVATVVRDLLR
jgi:hypothetical protein